MAFPIQRLPFAWIPECGKPNLFLEDARRDGVL